MNRFILETVVEDDGRLREIIKNYCKIKCRVSDYVLEEIRTALREKNYGALQELLVSFETIPTYLIQNSGSTSYRQQKTLNGYSFDIAKSAVQKYIRRGMWKSALHIGAEMDFFKEMDGGKGIITNFYNRLRIISLEDIGPASPRVLFEVDSALEKWKSSSGPSRELMQAIYTMAVSPHSRFYSHLRAYTRTLKDLPPQVPTKKYHLGKDEGLRKVVDSLIFCIETKDLKAWYWAEKILENETLQEKRPRSTRSGFLVLDILKTFLVKKEHLSTWKVCQKWYNTFKMKEAFLAIIHPLYIYILGDHANWKHMPLTFKGDVKDIYRQVVLNQKKTFEDFIIDMHTRAGKTMKRDSINFAVEGSLVAYEETFPKWSKLHKLKKIYTADKIAQGTIQFETDEFKLKARAQLICSGARPDSYFATDRLGKNVVVKGPYLDYDSALRVFNLQTAISLFEKINTYTVNMKLLYCDIFGLPAIGSIPLGTRTKITEGQPYYFIVMDDLFDLESYPTKRKTTKLWIDEEVVDFDKVYKENKHLGFGVASTMNSAARLSYLYQLSIRYAFEVGDFAERNLVRVGDSVYNIDLEGLFVSSNLGSKKTEQQLLASTYDQNKDEYIFTLNSWLNVEWSIIQTALQLSDEQIERVKNNIKTLINSPKGSLLVKVE